MQDSITDVERYRGFIANLKYVIILLLAHAHCMFYYFQHACGQYQIILEILIEMKICFLHLED